MKNLGLDPTLWAVLDGKLWHATGPLQLAGIIADGAIRVFCERYPNSLAKAHDSVSLMDFGPAAREDQFQFYNWSGWLGNQQKSRVPIWLEIDRRAVSGNLYDPEETLALNRATKPPLQFIPGIEACHRGPIPVSAILSVLLIDRHNHARFFECPLTSDIIAGPLADFEAGLPPRAEDGFAGKLEAAIAKLASVQ